MPQGYSPTQELSPAKRMSTSLNRFDNVKRRQMIRMKKRSNWFLSPAASKTGTSTSIDTESMMGSREQSVGGKSSKSSIDAVSSEALSVDAATTSDGGISDGGGARTPYDVECTFDEVTSSSHRNNHHHHTVLLSSAPKSDPLSKRSIITTTTTVHQDIVNGNHKGSTPVTTPVITSSHVTPRGSHNLMVATPPPWNSSHSRSPSPANTTSTTSGGGRGVSMEREVRYFMVENYYGTPAEHHHHHSHS